MPNGKNPKTGIKGRKPEGSDSIAPAPEPMLRGISLEEFVRRLHADTNADKRFAFFLGAGCSVTSGIPPAGGLVKDRWLPRLRDFKAPNRSDLEAWATETIPGYDPAHPQGRFNVVLTTNFDDLIADALYLYTEARPLVIYHESLASYIRPTRTRPLVVKLHGDHRRSPRGDFHGSISQ